MSIQDDLPDDPSKNKSLLDKNFILKWVMEFYRFILKVRHNYEYTRTVTASEVLSIDDCNINVDASAGNVVLTLPSLDELWNGKLYSIKKIDSSAYTVTVTVDGGDSETIDGLTTLVIAFQYDAPKIVLDDTDWWIR